MGEPRIFLGSSGKQEKLQADTRSPRRRTRGALDDILNPGTTTLVSPSSSLRMRSSSPRSRSLGRRILILHASGANLPSDLLGLTCVRYGEATTPTE